MTHSDPVPVILLAYTGDLESSVALSWLAERYDADVATLTLDVGQGTDLGDVRDRALSLGAIRAHVMDVRDEFARTAVAPALALGVGEPRVAALARPIVAKYLAQVAAIEGTSMVAHGSRIANTEPTGLNGLLAATHPSLRVLAPCRDWGMSEAAVIAYARERGVPVPVAGSELTSVRTLWGRALSGDVLRNAWAEVPSGGFTLTRSVGEWSTVPAMLDLEFAQGVPVSLNGIAMPLIELLPSLETIAGSHGLGRLDFAAVPGIRPRIVEEAPAPFLLHHAMKALSAVVPAMWPAVHGTVRMKCFMGECDIEEVSI
ncbi:MAG TPA: argininosuccinate synthase domain-containing protein [Vicinamibacterales bacterium]|nr:argininosuccinate synthase domain-containing protein [Vicinamibacterales bacterium]